MSSDERSAHEAEAGDFPGGRFSAAREAKGLSIAQVATELNLSPRYIEAIERGTLQQLPSMVFARGYVRNYARLLGLNVEEINAYLGGVVADGQTSGPRPVVKIPQDVKLSDPLMRWSGWLFLAVIISSVIWWWQTQYGNAVPVAEAAGAGAEVAVLEGAASGALKLPQLADMPADSERVAEEETVAANDPAGEDPAVAPATEEPEPEYLSDEEIARLAAQLGEADAEAQPVVEAEQAKLPVGLTAPAVEAPAEGQLAIRFRDACWVEVRDGKGKLLVAGIRDGANAVELQAQLPLRVLLGAVSSVESFSFNGKAVDLQASSHKNVARISLPAQ